MNHLIYVRVVAGQIVKKVSNTRLEQMKKIIFFALLLFCGCSERWVPVKTTRIDNIEAVFINRPNDYTVLIRDKNELIARSFIVGNYGNYGRAGYIKLLMDAKEFMWLEIQDYENKGSIGYRNKSEIQIHIRSKNDIQGGQWCERRGKSVVSGRVHKVE